MIRGAMILAFGFGLGYVKAVSDHEDIRLAAQAFQQFLVDLEAAEQKKAQKAQAAKEAVQKDEEPEVEIDEAVEVPVDPEPDIEQGETP